MSLNNNLRKDIEDVTIQFRTVRELFELFDSTEGDFLVCEGVSPKTFKQIEEAREERRRWKFFYPKTDQRLYVTLPRSRTEASHVNLYQYIRDRINRTRTTSYWKSAGCAAFNGKARPGTGFPEPYPRGPQDIWPTLVVLSGETESLGCLRRNMEWWFAASGHAVKIVILIKVLTNTWTLHLEKRTEGAPSRAGATTTRHTPLQPLLRQTITITPAAKAKPRPAYSVDGGPLVLEFALLFLREPDRERGEDDAAVGVHELKILAHMVRE